MKEKDYRKQIGKKLEEAYLSQPMGEPPSKETFAKWIEIAEERRTERMRRRKKLVSCAAVMIMCVCLGVACIVKPPQVEAGGKGGSKVEQTLETNDVYKSQSELPEEVKNEFLMFTETLDGYSLNEIKAENVTKIKTLIFSYKNDEGQELIIEETSASDNGDLKNFIDPESKIRKLDGIDVYFKKYTSGAQEKRFAFVYENILVEIAAPSDCNEEEIFHLIKKAVLK